MADDLSRRASSTDPSTWRSFEVALVAYLKGEADGIGFVLGEGYVGTDLDHCVDPVTGGIEGWAQEILDLLKLYSEFSPSETGIHTIVRDTCQMTEEAGRKVRWRCTARPATSR